MEHCKFTVSHLDMLEKAMAPHSSTLAWEISWAEEPGGLQCMGSQRAEHDLATKQQQQGQGEENGVC